MKLLRVFFKHYTTVENNTVATIISSSEMDNLVNEAKVLGQVREYVRQSGTKGYKSSRCHFATKAYVKPHVDAAGFSFCCGYSFCSQLDNVNKKRGRTIAARRLIDHIKKTTGRTFRLVENWHLVEVK